MNRRMEKINELIQQELSKIIHEEMIDTSQNYLVTVQEIQTAEDLKTARVWVSIFSQKISEIKKRQVIKKLQSRAYQFQNSLNQRINLRFIPKLTFKLDDSGEILQKIDEAIKKSK